VQDFINLDIALGGMGEGRQNNPILLSRYFNEWGLSYSGFVLLDNTMTGQNRSAYYWSQTESDSSLTRTLLFLITSADSIVIDPQGNLTKSAGRTLRCVRDTTPPPLPTGCNNNAPGWGNSLGTVTFATDNTWTVGSQVWSDVVTATSCQKNTYNGGDNPRVAPFNADCRSNSEGYPGDWFSWCAVVRFQHQLCPAPWRVPTMQDFVNLDIFFGGIGNFQTNPTLVNRYLHDWGATLLGSINVDQVPHEDIGTGSHHWALSDHNMELAFRLLILTSTINNVNPRATAFKSLGLALRCVRDI